MKASENIAEVARRVAINTCLRYRRMDLCDDVTQTIAVDMLERQAAGNPYLIGRWSGPSAFRKLVPRRTVKGKVYHDRDLLGLSLDDPDHHPAANQSAIPAAALVAVTRLQAMLPGLKATDRAVLADCVEGARQYRTERLRARSLLNRIGRLPALYGLEQECTMCGKVFLPTLKERRRCHGGRTGYASCGPCRDKKHKELGNYRRPR